MNETTELGRETDATRPVLGRRTIVRPTSQRRRFALATGVLVLCFAFPLGELCRFAASSSLDSYILLVPWISAFLVWQKRNVVPVPTNPDRKKAALFFTAGAALAIVAGSGRYGGWSLLNHEYLTIMTTGFLLCFFGVCHWFLGREAVRILAFPLRFLILLVPLPMAGLNLIDRVLQAGSAEVAAALFWLAGTPCLREGMMFQLPGIRLLVAPECSGSHSTFVLFITSLLAGHLFLRTPWKRWLLVGVVVPLGLLRNGFRVFTIGELCSRLGPQMINSYIHRKGGPIFFLLALIPFLLLLWWLYRSETRRHRKENPSRPADVSGGSRSLLPGLLAALLTVTVLGGAGCTAKMKASHHLQRAEKYLAAEQYAPAEIEFKQVLLNAPQNGDAWAGLGLIYFNQGRLLEAMPVLVRAAQLKTNELSLHQKLGMCYLGLGLMAEARKEAGLILARAPQDEHAPILLADTVMITNDIASIRSRLQQLKPTGNPASIEVALGALALREPDLPAARGCFQRAIALNPNFSDAYSALGLLDVAENDWKHADADFKTAAELAPVWSGNGVRYAKFKMLAGDPAAGGKMLRDIVQKHPDFLPAWVALAQCSVAQKQYAAGLEQLDQVLSRDPRNLAGMELQAQIHSLLGRNDLAVAGFERLARLYPQWPSIRDQLARAYLANNRTNEAADTLRQCLNKFPEDAGAQLLLAQIERHNGDAAGAVATLKALVRQQPGLVQGWLLLAETYRQQDAPADAIPIYESLKRQFPESPQFPLLLGGTWLQSGDHAPARAEFTRALRLAPGSLPALEQLVNLDLQETNYAAAQKLVDASLDLHPDQAALYLLRARLLAARGETNAAAAAILKAAERQPASPAPYLLLGRLHLSSGQYALALSDVEEALKRDARNTAALALKGMVYDALRDYPPARDTYLKLLELNPDDALALNNLAFDYAEHLGQMDLACSLAGRARKLAPTDPMVADTYGWILFRLGQPARALPLLRESAGRLASSALAQYHLGMAAYRLGNEAEARSAFHRALQSPDGLRETNDCSARLSLLELDAKNCTPDHRARLEKWVAGHPEDPVALARLAGVYQTLNLTNQVDGAYEGLLKATPENVPALLDYARWLTPANPQKAIILARQAYQLKPQDPEVMHVLGRLAYLTGDFSWARILLQLTVQTQPGSAEAQFDLAEALYAVGQVAEARATMQQALPSGGFPRAGLARQFLWLTGLADHSPELLAARERVEQVLKADPDNLPALVAKAMIAEDQTNWAAAERTGEQILRRYPEFTPAQRLLALAYARDPGNDTKALALAARAHRAFPQDAEVTKLLGILTYRQGNYSGAIAYLQDSARRLPHDAELLYYQGMARYRLKEFKESKASLQQALLLNLSGVQANEVRQLLAAWPAS